MQDMKVALFTIEDLKKNHPDYYRRLNPKCQVCQNILSSSECDMCEDFDMFARAKEEMKMDRQQFENFCKNLYQTAYEEGRRSVPGIDITEVQKAISETPGIGAKRLEAIMESLNSRFAKEEDA